MLTKSSVKLLMDLWAMGVQEHIEEDLKTVHLAMEIATDEATFRTLQGKARAYRAMIKLPEHLAMRLDGEIPPAYGTTESPFDPRDILAAAEDRGTAGIPSDEMDD